jgi:hypothetical protein
MVVKSVPLSFKLRAPLPGVELAVNDSGLERNPSHHRSQAPRYDIKFMRSLNKKLECWWIKCSTSLVGFYAALAIGGRVWRIELACIYVQWGGDSGVFLMNSTL